MSMNSMSLPFMQYANPMPRPLSLLSIYALSLPDSLPISAVYFFRSMSDHTLMIGRIVRHVSGQVFFFQTAEAMF